MGIADWNIINTGYTVAGQDPTSQITGANSLRFSGTGGADRAHVLPKPQIPHSFGQGKLRALVKVTAGASDFCLSGIILFPTAENIQSTGNCYAVAFVPGLAGTNRINIGKYSLNTGISGSGFTSVLATSANAAFTLGTTKAIEVEWHSRYNVFGGVQIIVRTGNMTDFSDLTLLHNVVDATTPLVCTAGEGHYASKVNSGSTSHITFIDTTTLTEMVFTGVNPTLDLVTNLHVYNRMNGTGDLTDAALAIVNNPITLNAAPTTATGQVTANSILFNGTTQSAQGADSATRSVGDIKFSVSCWVYFNSVAGTQSLVCKGPGTDNNDAYRLYLDSDGKIKFRVGNTTTSGVVDSGITPVISTWYFVVGTHDENTNQLAISVNNSTLVTASYSGGSYDDANICAYGKRGSAAAEFVNGRMQACALWKFRKLTQTEIAYLYFSGAGRDFAF